MGGSLCPHSPRRRGGMVNPSDATSTSGWAYGPAAVRMGGSLVPARGSRAARWVSGRERPGVSAERRSVDRGRGTDRGRPQEARWSRPGGRGRPRWPRPRPRPTHPCARSERGRSGGAGGRRHRGRPPRHRRSDPNRQDYAATYPPGCARGRPHALHGRAGSRAPTTSRGPRGRRKVRRGRREVETRARCITCEI